MTDSDSLTIGQIAEMVKNRRFHNYTYYRIGDTVITPKVMPSERNKGKVLVKNKANPYGVMVFEDGEVEIPSEIEDILPTLSERDQDLWAINTFGVFR